MSVVAVPTPLPDTARVERPRAWRGAVAGLVAALVALGVGELVSGVVRGTTGPVISVGEWVIEHTPASLKEYAIRKFGTGDKAALISGTVIILLVVSTAIGVAATRRRWIGAVGVALFAAVGVATAATRPTAPTTAALPSLVAGLAAEACLFALLGLLASRSMRATVARVDAERTTAEVVHRPEERTALSRRGFLASAGLAASGAAVAGGVGRMLRSRFDVSAARAKIRLPRAISAAAVVPTDAEIGVSGIAPFITPNTAFYRVDTALVAPQVSPDGWRLRVHGKVARELHFTYDELLARPLVERDITLVCVSNEVGGSYAGTARWLGVALRELLEEAGVDPDADQLVSRSADGWTAGTPTAAIMDGRDALIAVAMNGEPLPVAHGFPARLVVPGLYGYTSATKWLTDLELSTFDAFDGYWVRRGWAQVAPVKTLTRIDTPRGLSTVGTGAVMIGGVAWAIHRGIDRVEVRVDDGPWRPARLGGVPSVDTWRQWSIDWDATPGSHTIAARATDGEGHLQTEDRAEPIPDGASGWHSIVVLVKG